MRTAERATVQRTHPKIPQFSIVFEERLEKLVDLYRSEGHPDVEYGKGSQVPGTRVVMRN